MRAPAAMGEPHNFAASISRRGSMGRVFKVRSRIDDREVGCVSVRGEARREGSRRGMRILFARAPIPRRERDAVVSRR